MLPEREFDRQALFERFGEFVDSLGGRYVTCEDSGTSTGDMDVIATRTRHVLGTSKGSADPSPFTALGVRRAMEATVRYKLGRDSLEGLHIAVQGVGHVGYHLVKEVARLGAKVTVADTNQQATDLAHAEFGAEVVSTDEILFTQCDILAPCALGAVFNDATIPKLRTGMVVGASNNVLAESRHGDALRARGILYAPDYVANAGGLINVATEHSPDGYNRQTATAKVMGIYDTVLNILQRAEREDVSTHIVADRIVDEMIF
jgi:leucine dehydrogenase